MAFCGVRGTEPESADDLGTENSQALKWPKEGEGTCGPCRRVMHEALMKFLCTKYTRAVDGACGIIYDDWRMTKRLLAKPRFFLSRPPEAAACFPSGTRGHADCDITLETSSKIERHEAHLLFLLLALQLLIFFF